MVNHPFRSAHKPGDLLIRLRHGEHGGYEYWNPYINQAVAMRGHILSSEDLRLRSTELFSHPSPLIVEVGCYKGTTLCKLAEHNPHCRFMGIDIKYKRVVLSHRKIAAAGLDSRISIALIEMVELLGLLPDRSISGFCIFFPDPWEKERYVDRRLISPLVLDSICRVLKPSGFLWLKTDHLDYHQHMTQALSTTPLRPCPPPPAPLTDHPYPTDFENLFSRIARPCFEICLTKPHDEVQGDGP